MDDGKQGSSTRRTFFFWMVGGIGAVLGGAGGWALLRFLSPGQSQVSATLVELLVTDVAVGGAKFFDLRGRPAVVLQPRPGEFVAVSAVCTHLGCIVKWVPEKERFICPCHGGAFSPAGVVLGGPPPAPLQSFPVRRIGDRLQIG